MFCQRKSRRINKIPLGSYVPKGIFSVQKNLVLFRCMGVLKLDLAHILCRAG